MLIVGERRWRAEAFSAVLGDAEWAYVTAGVTPDRAKLFALYEHRLTSKRRMVTLARDRFRTLPERLNEIHRRLRSEATQEDDQVQAIERDERQA